MLLRIFSKEKKPINSFINITETGCTERINTLSNLNSLTYMRYAKIILSKLSTVGDLYAYAFFLKGYSIKRLA